MPGVEDDVVVDLGEAPQALDHLVVIAAGQVGAATPVQEQRVPGDELAAHHEALAPGGVPGGVDELDLDVADPHDVARIVIRQVGLVDAGRAHDPRHLVALDVDRARHLFEQPGDAGDLVPEDRPTDVVGVVVGREHPGDRHAVGSHGRDQTRGIVGRVDEHTLTGGTVADRVHEVDHLRRHLVVDREVATRQQLAEVEAVVGLGHGPSVR